MVLTEVQEYEIAKWQMLFGNERVDVPELKKAGVDYEILPIGLYRSSIYKSGMNEGLKLKSREEREVIISNWGKQEASMLSKWGKQNEAKQKTGI